MTHPIHFETYGTDKPEIVICNGLSQSTANWRGIARQQNGYRWLLFDARGHGKSLVRKRPYHIDDHVEDLRFVLDHCGAQKPLLMGFSHGARIALRAAAEHPELFSGLVLVSCGSQMHARRRAYLASWEQSLKMGGVRAMAWASLPSIVGRKLLERFNDLEFMVRGTVARNQEEGLLAVFEGMASYPPAQEDARRIPLPTLVLWGGEDPLVNAEDGRDFESWIADARVHCFEDCGHTLSLEEPERFMTLVSNFYQGIVSR